MGWQNYPLHRFEIGGKEYGNPDETDDFDWPIIDARKVKLRNVLPGEGSKFIYEYDFGDSWIHTILIERLLPPQQGVQYLICIKGKRACPPENCGGIWGYERQRGCGIRMSSRSSIEHLPTHPHHRYPPPEPLCIDGRGYPAYAVGR